MKELGKRQGVEERERERGERERGRERWAKWMERVSKYITELILAKRFKMDKFVLMLPC